MSVSSSERCAADNCVNQLRESAANSLICAFLRIGAFLWKTTVASNTVLVLTYFTTRISRITSHYGLRRMSHERLVKYTSGLLRTYWYTYLYVQ